MGFEERKRQHCQANLAKQNKRSPELRGRRLSQLRDYHVYYLLFLCFVVLIVDQVADEEGTFKLHTFTALLQKLKDFRKQDFLDFYWVEVLYVDPYVLDEDFQRPPASFFCKNIFKENAKILQKP